MQDNRTPLRVRLARIAVWIAASLTALTFGMLGLGAMRTIERIKR
jgi:predicted exporter